jgi:hypothetical protein
MAATPLVRATPVHQWSKKFGDTDNQAARSVAFDASGNAIIVGYMEGTTDFGGGPLVAIGGFDAFIAKFDVVGGHLWSKRFGDGGLQQIFSVDTDAAGNIAVLGIFQGSIDLGGGALVSAGDWDVFLAKFDAGGAHLWSKRFGAGSIDDARGVNVDGSGNVIVAGFSQGGIDFGGGALASGGSHDAFVAKFDAAGSHLWSDMWGGAGEQQAFSVASDAAGNLFVGGQFNASLDLGGGAMVTAGGLDAFIAKFDGSGVFQWNQRFGDGAEQKMMFVGVDASGDVTAAGNFGGTIDFGGGPIASVGSIDVFAAQFNSAGSHQWSGGYGSAVVEEMWGLAVHSTGNVILAGYSQGGIDFGGGALPNAGGEDMFMARIDPTGVHVWSKSYGSTSYQSAFGVAVANNGDLLLGGQFLNSVNFGGATLTSAGSGDASLARFSDDMPIPVLFQDFRAVSRGATVEVSWELASDEPLDVYTLYRAAGDSRATAVTRGVMDAGVRSFIDAEVTPATTYRYELVVRAQSGDEFRSPIATVTTPTVSTSLGQNHPNPFNPSTTIEYALSERAPVVIAIFDATGALVVRLDEGVRGAGTHRVAWDGRDASGALVGSGVYFYRLEGSPAAGARKMVLLK